MLADLEELLDKEVNRGRRLEDFQAAADLLLQRQFAYRGDRGSSRLVATIFANRGYFEDLMVALGRHLVVDDRIGMVGAVPLDGRGRRVPLEDTLLLLTMRFIYQEGIPARLTEGGEVEATTEEVVSKLEELTRRRRADLPRLRDWTRLREVVAGLGSGIVREGEPVEDEEKNRVLVLRAGLLYAVGADALARLEAFASEMEVRHRATTAVEEQGSDNGPSAEVAPG